MLLNVSSYLHELKLKPHFLAAGDAYFRYVICNLFTLNILSWTEANRSIVTKGTFERRKLLLVTSIGFTTGAFQNALDNGVAVAAEFADSKFSKFMFQYI